jgi:hypothetical protein
MAYLGILISEGSTKAREGKNVKELLSSGHSGGNTPVAIGGGTQ